MERRIEEKNYSERIIREKEKLLKEKEETIRQQANLIQTQHELLGQRKLMNIPNIGLAKVHYDVVFKPRILTPLAETAEFAGHEKVHPNGQENQSQTVADNEYEQKNCFDRNNVVEPIVPTRQEQSNQPFNMCSPTSFTNTQINHSTLGIPVQHNANTFTSAPPYRPSFYASQSSIYNVPPPNGPTSNVQARLYQSKEHRRNNIKKDELQDDDAKQSTSQLLVDLDKQTNYELQKLSNVSSRNSSRENVDVKLNSGDKRVKQAKVVHAIFKCRGCSVTWKAKTAVIGATQKCKKCGNDVESVR